jgi:serine/threonine-protein kinase
MQLTPDKWEKVKVLFEAAAEQSPQTRASFLSRECPEDDIRSEVERLLYLDAQRGHFLSGPAIQHRSSTSKEGLTGSCAAGDILARRFRVIQFLAKGGMGEVYEADDLELREHVAIKLIRPEVLMIQLDALGRFRREVRLAKRVTHPNVCRIFDMFRHATAQRVGSRRGGDLILVSMELLRGETLSQRMKRVGRMSPDEVLPILVQMASALDAAHQMDILHRDFKPGNVFLVPARQRTATRVVVTDFGLALGLASDANISLTSISTHPFMGTPAYMSPEQIEGFKLTAASDIYSLGLVIYEMVTGERAFEDDVPAIMAVRRLREAPAPPHLWAPELNEVWEGAILRCLERDPNRRFRSAADLVRVLSRKSGAARQEKRQSYKSLAVLPFVNSGGTPDTEYLSDGITENIINALSQMPELRVIARSTAFGYKGRDSDPRRVGCDLHVGSVLTGRVAQRGKILSVSTELVDVNSGWQLLGEQYDRTFDDIFAVQAEIASEISLKLRLKLSSAQREKLNKRHTRSAEAHHLFLKGRYCWNKKTESGIRKSIEYFNQAIMCDPVFAQDTRVWLTHTQPLVFICSSQLHLRK